MTLVTLQPQPKSFRDRLRHLTPPQKLGLLAAASALVAALAAGYLWRQPALQPLASGLNDEQSAQVVAKLDELKVPYRLSSSGAILVASHDLPRIRLELAGSGLPESSEAGFSLFDRVNLQTTEFSERVNYVRALQGELAETIRAIPGVKKVRVHLNIPNDGLFLEEHRAPSASVLLTLAPGAGLSRTQARAILKLVACSVPNLKIDEVTLGDTRGQLLYSGEEELSDYTGREEETVARQLQRAAQTVVDRVLGPGGGVVNVRVELQKDVRKVESTTVQPGRDGKGFERTRKLTEEEYEGALKNAAGNITVPPPAPGAGNQTAANASASRPSYHQSLEQVEYEYGKRIESVEENPNRIRRITASVVVDQATKLDQKGEAALLDAISLAVGIDAKRGDRCSVQRITFNRAAEREEDENSAALAKANRQTQWSLALLVGVVALAGLALLATRLRRKKPNLPITAEAPPQVGSRVDISLPGEEAHPALPPKPHHDEILEQARQYALEHPEQVARLLQGWLESDRAKR